MQACSCINYPRAVPHRLRSECCETRETFPTPSQLPSGLVPMAQKCGLLYIYAPLYECITPLELSVLRPCMQICLLYWFALVFSFFLLVFVPLPILHMSAFFPRCSFCFFYPLILRSTSSSFIKSPFLYGVLRECDLTHRVAVICSDYVPQ